MLRTSVSNRQSITLHETNGGTWALIWIDYSRFQIACEWNWSIHTFDPNSRDFYKKAHEFVSCVWIDQSRKWRRVRLSKYYAFTPQHEEDFTAKKIGEERSSPKGTASNGKARALQKDPPAGSKNLVVGKKSLNNTATPNSKWVKETSTSEAHYQWQIFRTSSLQSPMLTGVRSQPKWGLADAF